MKIGNLQAVCDWLTLIGQISINRESLGKSRNKIFPINGIQLYNESVEMLKVSSVQPFLGFAVMISWLSYWIGV